MEVLEISKEQTGSKNIKPENINGKSNETQINKLVFTIKLLVFGLSTIYLLYEVIKLIQIYYNYDTVVTVYYEYKTQNQIPSVTICLPAIISRSKLFAKYPDLEQKMNESENEVKKRDILTEYLDNTLDSMNWTHLTVQENEIFNCTLNYWPMDYIYSKDSMTLNCREVIKPIESYSNKKGKCFTYFSLINSDENSGEYSLASRVTNLNDMNQIINIEFELNNERQLSLGFIENETTLAIHHHKMIPHIDIESQQIEAGNQYDVTINKISSKLLEKPYKTMCYNYGNKVKSRQDCIDNCVVELYRSKCNCIPYHLVNTLQLLNVSAQTVCGRYDSSFRGNSCYAGISREVGLCLTSERCPFSCESIRYISRTRSKQLSPGVENSDQDFKNKVKIRILYDQSIGDTVEKHVPVMSFVRLLSNICSLIAIFSGLSFIGFANLIIDRIVSIDLMPRRQVCDEEENPSLRTNEQIQHKSRCNGQQSNSEALTCISNCITSPKKLRIPCKKSSTAIYDCSTVDVKAQDKY